MIDLAGRVAVITGASRGIGAGLARELRARGLRLGLCARGEIDVPPGEDALVERLDVTDEPAVRRFAELVAGRFGRIDLWINNAGVGGPLGRLRDVANRDIEETFAVNVLGVINGTRAFIEIVRRQGAPGVLINMSSGAARRGFPGMAAYCASKAAVDRITESVQAEEQGSGLRAFSVAPGMIDTAMQARLRDASPEALPDVDFYREIARAGAFSSTEFVARELLALAFDPARQPDAVSISLRPERPIPR